MAGKTIDAVTTITDLHPTTLQAMDIEPDPRVTGRSLVPLLTGETKSVREGCLFGYFNRGLYCTDGRWMLCKDVADADAESYLYGVNFDAPFWSGPEKQLDLQAGPWEAGDFIPHAGRLVFRRPAQPPWGAGKDYDALIDLSEDYECANNQWDTNPDQRQRMLDLMRAQMKENDFPEEHYKRLGL